MKYSYLLLDLDGTVTDSMTGITRSVQYALKHFGIEIKELSLLQPFIGPPLKDSFKEFYHFTEEQAILATSKYHEYFSSKGIYTFLTSSPAIPVTSSGGNVPPCISVICLAVSDSTRKLFVAQTPLVPPLTVLHETSSPFSNLICKGH